MNYLSRFIATGFFTGYLPGIPGTVGSIIALIILWFVPGLRGVPLLVLTVVTFFIGVWAATKVEKTDGRDASIINIDEIVGVWFTLLFFPEGLSILWFCCAFFLFRCFDVLKPFPVRRSQNLTKGWGVMMDDVLAGIYANLVLRLIYLYFRSYSK